MQEEDDLRGLAKVADFTRALSPLALASHTHCSCYERAAQTG